MAPAALASSSDSEVLSLESTIWMPSASMILRSGLESIKTIGILSLEPVFGVCENTGASMTKSPKPKRPNTMDGTPARLSMARRMILVKPPFLAYSLR